MTFSPTACGNTHLFNLQSPKASRGSLARGEGTVRVDAYQELAPASLGGGCFRDARSTSGAGLVGAFGACS
jgi:hypothetical protein